MTSTISKSDDITVLKIGVNATVLGQKPTGVGVFTWNIVKSMDLLADHLVVWVSDRKFAQLTRGTLLKPRSRLRAYMLNSPFFRAIWDQLGFPVEIAQQGVDIVFFPMQEGMLFPPVPQIVFVHDLAPLKFPRRVPLLRKISYRTRIPIILRNSAAIAVPTEAVRREILETYLFLAPEKIHVIGEGYDDTHFRPLHSPRPIIEGKYLLFVGNRCENKNLVRVIAAFADLGIPDCRLIIAGKSLDRKYATRLSRLTVELGIENYVDFLDYVPHDLLPDLYTRAKLLIFPSLYEGFGLPIVESMACGTPVITSNRSAMAEVAGDAALLVDPYSVESITQAMHKVLSNPELVEKMRIAGLERSKMLRWSNAAMKLYELCKIVSKS